MRKKLERLQAIRKIHQKRWLKNLIKPLAIISIITLILSSCIWALGHIGDPMQNLTFINRTQPSATVILETKNPQDNALNQPIKNYELGQGHREQPIFFGIGNWSEAEIIRVSSQIDKITIVSDDKTVVYDKPEQIEKLLKTNWEKSGQKNSIDIAID